MFSTNMLEQALWLESQGCSVIPLYPHSKRPCAELLPHSPDGKSSWKEYQTRRATADEIRGWFERNPNINIGLVCGAISGIVCVDVDGEQGKEWFKAHMPKPNLWQQTSSPNKFHAFYRHPGTGHHIPPSVKGIHNEIDIRGDGSYCVIAPSVHPDTGKAYVLNNYGEFAGMDSLVPCPNVQIGKTDDDTSCTIAEDVVIPDGQNFTEVPEGKRDSTLTRWCARWYAKGLSVDEITMMAYAFNSSKCKPPLPDKDVEKIVNSIGKTHARNHPLVFNTKGLQKWVDMQGSGTFTINDVFQQLGIRHPSDRESVLMCLKSMQDSGKIEHAGKNTSTYRRIANDAKKIDLLAEDKGIVFPMWFPFGLTERLQIRQKNVIIVAGECNSGKTALLFNIMYMNQKRYKFKYITSEMTADEISTRIKLMGDTREHFLQFCDFYNKTHDYADDIDPEGMNIVDFIEIYDNFYRIGEEIKKIFDKLTTGCAIIAVQKKHGETFGRGGEFTVEKARLALSLFTHGRMKDGIVGSCLITKCKSYVPNRNPEGLEFFYVLKNGFYYDNELVGVFERSAVGIQKKQRNELLAKINDYCKHNQRQAEPPENIDAYGYIRERNVQ